MGPKAPLITIPVVVHVVFNTLAEKLDEEVIRAQIDELNLAFRGALKPGRNAHATLSALPAPYASRVGDARVQFCLATRDPNGQPTKGITYRDNTDSVRYQVLSDKAVMHTDSGGTDAWNTAHYLNIWCHAAEAAGRGIFPGTASDPREDGVVMNYDAFGSGHAALRRGHILGRVAAHEVGHWLNLRHIWGLSTKFMNCTDSDYVSDTPNQFEGDDGNPRYPHFSNPPCPNEPDGDMFMNHMDYTDDDSKLMFSRYQALRMQAIFAPTTPTRPGGYRESLRSSPGLCPTLGITSQSGWLPTTIQAGDTSDYGFRVNPFFPGCGGGSIRYVWTATGGWRVTNPNQFYPRIIPSGNSASVITLTGTYYNAQGFSFPLNTVQYTVHYIQAVATPANPDQPGAPLATPVFTSPAAARCAGIGYAATVAPVAGAGSYQWTVPAGFELPGTPPVAITGPVTTTAPALTVAPTAALPGGVYLLQCQALAPNRPASALAAVPLTVNGGPRYRIVDSDAYQRTAQGIVCQRNRIFLELEPVGPTVPGAVKVFPDSITWSSSISAVITVIGRYSINSQVEYQTVDAPDSSFEVRATYTNPCDSLFVTTDPYIARTAPANTDSLSNGYRCRTYPWRQSPPVLPPSAPYPNPAADRLHLPGYRGAVVVYDHQGQPVQRLLAPGTEAGAALDTSTWPEGLYVVTGRNLLGEWQRHNVQVQH